MTLPPLRADALRSRAGGFSLRLSLPWIRSLPLACLSDLEVWLDGEPVTGLAVQRAAGEIPLAELSGEPGWWYIQDRLVVHGDAPLHAGSHIVAVSFRLAVPYLPGGRDGPLTLPFHVTAPLTPHTPDARFIGRDVV